MIPMPAQSFTSYLIRKSVQSYSLRQKCLLPINRNTANRVLLLNKEIAEQRQISKKECTDNNQFQQRLVNQLVAKKVDYCTQVKSTSKMQLKPQKKINYLTEKKEDIVPTFPKDLKIQKEALQKLFIRRQDIDEEFAIVTEAESQPPTTLNKKQRAQIDNFSEMDLLKYFKEFKILQTDIWKIRENRIYFQKKFRQKNKKKDEYLEDWQAIKHMDEKVYSRLLKTICDKFGITSASILHLDPEGLYYDIVESPKTSKNQKNNCKGFMREPQQYRPNVKQLTTPQIKNNNLPSSIFEESITDSEHSEKHSPQPSNEYLLYQQKQFEEQRPQTQSDTQMQKWIQNQKNKPETANLSQYRVEQKLQKISSMAMSPQTPYLTRPLDASSLQLTHRSLYNPRASFYLQCTTHQQLQPDRKESYLRINEFYEECQNETKIMNEENSFISKELNDIESQWKRYAFSLKSKEIDGKTSSEFQLFIEQREFKRKLIQYLLYQLNHDNKLLIMKKYADNYEKHPDTVIPVQYNFKNMPNMEAFLTNNSLNQEIVQRQVKLKSNQKKKQQSTDIFEKYLEANTKMNDKIKNTALLIKKTNEIIRSTNPKP